MNPGADYGKEFFSAEIQVLLNGTINKKVKSITVEKETSVLLGQPSVYPHALVNDLIDKFKKIPSVHSAYLAHFHNPSEDTAPHTLIGIESSGDWEKEMDEIGMVLSNYGTKDVPIDVIRINKNEMSGVARYLIDQTKPFYKKRIWGIF